MDLLSDYYSKAELAKGLKVTERTINRYMNEPDGLPHLMVGGCIYFKIENVKRWLESRERRPNPRRRAA